MVKYTIYEVLRWAVAFVLLAGFVVYSVFGDIDRTSYPIKRIKGLKSDVDVVTAGKFTQKHYQKLLYKTYLV